MKLKELKTEFYKKGYTYTQLHKDNNVVLYKVQDKEDGDTYYEIFKYKTQVLKPTFATQAYIDEGYTDMELYPTTESFGTWAWCCRGKLGIDKVLKVNFDNVSLNTENLIQ